MKCIDVSDVYHLAIGDLDPQRAAAVERHVSECEKCAAVHEEVGEMVRRLKPDPDEFSDQAFAGDVMTLIRLGRARSQEPPSWFRKWQTWVTVPVVAAAAAAAVILVWPQPHSSAPRFQARGAAESPDSWVSIQAYRARGQHYVPVSGALGSSEALAFSYTNRPRGHYRYLMIFAVDESGRTFWYFPAHVHPGQNPASIAIAASDNPQTLPEQVRHQLKPGPLRVFGVFSRKPLAVRDVETQIAKDLAAAGSLGSLSRLGLEHTGQHAFLVNVTAGIQHDEQP